MITLKKIFNCIGAVNEWVGRICHPLILVMSLVVFIEIVARNLFNRPTVWSFEVTLFLFACVSLMSGGILEKHRGHISVDIVVSHLSLKARMVCKIICFPFFLLFIGAMVYFGSSFFWESMRSWETSGTAWDPYIWPIKIFLPLGAILLLLQAIVNFVQDIEDAFFRKNADTTFKKDSLSI